MVSAGLARATGSDSPAAVCVRAALPWSIEHHLLWPPPARAHAFAIMRIGYAIAWGKAEGALAPSRLSQPSSLIDSWQRVMALAMRRADGAETVHEVS